MYAQIEGNEIKLYGSIWEGDGTYVVSQISKTLAKAKTDVDIHLHTSGGSVFDGNLIFNAIANAKANVTVYIDGLAASMGAIIMLAAKTIKMAENAYIMIHAPSGLARGNAKEFENTAKLLRSMEANFMKKLIAKSNHTEAEAKELMNGDNWFSAEEAKAVGLIDEVVDSVLEESDLTAYQDVKMCAQLFEVYDKKPNEETPPSISNNQNEEEMKLTAESLLKLGLKEGATEAEINAAIDAKDKRVSELETKSKEDHQAKCEALVANAITAGRIPGGEKAAWIADATANFEMAERMIAKLPVKKSLEATETAFTDSDEKTKDWNFDKWRKSNPSGLMKMKKDSPDQYAALLESK